MIKGCYDVISSDSIRITELPNGTWTTSYKEYLETLDIDKNSKKSNVKSVTDMSTDAIVDLVVKFQPNTLGKLVSKSVDEHHNMLEKKLKLSITKKRPTCTCLIISSNSSLKYENIYDIIDCYFPNYIGGYVKRKEYLIKHIERIVMILSNKARFIQEQCDDKIDLRRKKKDQVIDMLKQLEYDVIDDDVEYKYLKNYDN